MAARGHSIVVVTRSLGEKSVDKIRFNFKVIRQPNPKEELEVWRWADVILQNNIELRSLWPVLFVRKPFVIATHTWIKSQYGKERLIDKIKKWVIKRANYSICVSEALRDTISSESVVIGNPYDSAVFKTYNDVMRHKAIVFVGRLVSDKGVDILLRAFRRLVDEGIRVFNQDGSEADLCMTIIGAGPEAKSLWNIVSDLKLSQHVRFAGELTGARLVKELNTHVVLAVPSKWEEPFGLVALEGSACGCVVIGSDSGGLPEAIGPAGISFKSQDIDNLKEGLIRLLTSTETQESIRKSSLSHLHQHSPEMVTDKYLDVLSNASETTTRLGRS